MAADKIYPVGCMTFKRNEKAPSFILGTLVISPKEFLAWLNGEGNEYLTEYNGTKQIRLTILQGRDKINLQVDTWKPTQKAEVVDNHDYSTVPTQEDDGLPF